MWIIFIYGLLSFLAVNANEYYKSDIERTNKMDYEYIDTDHLYAEDGIEMNKYKKYHKSSDYLEETDYEQIRKIQKEKLQKLHEVEKEAIDKLSEELDKWPTRLHNQIKKHHYSKVLNTSYYMSLLTGILSAKLYHNSNINI